MKKVFSIICKLFIWAIIVLFITMLILALIVGLLEGDLSLGWLDCL